MKRKNSLTLTSTFTQSWPTKLVSLAFGLVLLSTSCKESKKLSLERQLEPNASGIVAVDSFRISVETVVIDTPSTKNKPHIIIGDYTDTDFGEIHAEAFAHLRFYGFDTLKFEAGYEIDSINFGLYPDFILGYNTTSNLNIGIHQLTSTIDTTKEYNYRSTIGYENDALVNFSFPFTTQTTQSVTLKKDSTNTKLTAQFEATKNLFESCNGFSQSRFTEQFKGLAFIPTKESDNTYAIGLRTGGTSSFGITVYYHIGADQTPVYRVFGIYDYTSSSIPRFTRVSLSGTPEPMKQFVEGSVKVLPSSQTNNRGYLNDMLGIRTRITFPGVSAFLNQIKDKYIITEATILLPYTDQTYNQETTRPTPTLSLIECDPMGLPLRNTSDTLYKYKIVQNEVSSNGIRGDLNGVARDYYTTFQNYYKRFYYPFSLYAQDIEKGIKPNNPFIPSLSSNTGTFITQSPIGYTFFDQSQSNGIRLLIILNKLN